MNKIFLLILCVCFYGVSEAQSTKKQITLDDLYKYNTFKIKDVPGFNAMADGKHYTRKDDENGHQYIRIYELETGTLIKTVFDNIVQKDDTTTLKIDAYTWSKDESKLLLFTAGESVYRRSASYRVYVYDINTGKVSLLMKEKVLHATFSPDGKKVAFVRDNNLYYKDLTNNDVIAISTDGARNAIINGNCDWVYEEEFEFTRAFDWSGDSRYLGYYRFDESKVPEYTMAKYTGLYPTQYTYKYPKAGERNSDIQIKIFDINNRSTVNADLGHEKDIYIPRIKWIPNGDNLMVYRLNRHQNHLEMLLTDAATGHSKPVYVEKNRYYISINDEVTFLEDGHSMVFKSEKEGYNQLFYYNWQTKALNNLTSGTYDVDALVGVDKARKLIYYTAAMESPVNRELYVVDINGHHRKCLTLSKGMHTITACEGYNFFIDKFSALNSVPVYSLIDADGRAVKVLENNSALDEKLKEYELGKIELVKLPGVDRKLNGWMITPPNFDKSKKYPVLMYQYSGPGSQEVANKFPVGNFFWHQMLAQKGYIIVCVDGTGTGFRGEAFKKKTYKQLGKYESDDQIAVAKYLAEQPWVDKERIGIWGWSYGGFMSSTCLLKGHEVFKAAIAVAPVTNWRYYDNIYTERYMRTPMENPQGYDENSPVNMVDKLSGKLLLVHGTADDNVHFQNSAMFITALVNANKDFDSEYYPDKAHGISGGNTRNHLYRRMTNFILENL